MSYSKLHQNFSEPRGHSSAVASVLYSRGADTHQVTKSGSYIYSGEASNYHENGNSAFACALELREVTLKSTLKQ